MTKSVADRRAETLEATGLWRRAAARWLDVMQLPDLSDRQRDWIRQRRTYCLSKAVSVPPTGRLDVSALLRAVSAAEKRLGLSPAEPKTFRLKRYKNRKLHPAPPVGGM